MIFCEQRPAVSHPEPRWQHQKIQKRDSCLLYLPNSQKRFIGAKNIQGLFSLKPLVDMRQIAIARWDMD